MESGIRLEPAQVAAILAEQFPELELRNVHYQGEGCDSCTFAVNLEWIFRFPKRADVDKQLAIESRILPVLAEQSPLPLPVFSFHGRPSSAYPYSFVGYRRLVGFPGIHIDRRALTSEKWAPALGRFLSWLHRFPVEQACALGVPRRGVAALLDEVRTEALEDFDLLRKVIRDGPFDEWRAFFEAGCPLTDPTDGTAVLVHGDLAREHVIFDTFRNRVTGIIDWSDMTVTDRSLDLAAFFHWGGRACLDAVLAAYDGPVDDGVVKRARFFAACRGIGDVAFGLENRRREYIEGGIDAVAQCLGEKV